jgi:thymidylate synthase (FAD)|tara:strand:- start:1281 stop:1979 length:699 start_codon:yes stop_codon:yes gene_type:complete
MMKIDLYGDGIGSVDYVSHMGSDLTVVNSARVSFGVEKQELEEKDKKLISYLIKHKHTSTLEHNLITFRFVVPLFIRSQHHRHRTWSYNEISRRYTEIGMRFYEPKEFRTQHGSNRQASNIEDLFDPLIDPEGTSGGSNASYLVSAHHRTSVRLYEKLLANGICREQARGILPQNMYTEYYGTTNLNNLLKFIDLRSHEGAQWEIQRVAAACLEIAKSLYPITVRAYVESKT